MKELESVHATALQVIVELGGKATTGEFKNLAGLAKGSDPSNIFKSLRQRDFIKFQKINATQNIWVATAKGKKHLASNPQLIKPYSILLDYFEEKAKNKRPYKKKVPAVKEAECIPRLSKERPKKSPQYAVSDNPILNDTVSGLVRLAEGAQNEGKYKKALLKIQEVVTEALTD